MRSMIAALLMCIACVQAGQAACRDDLVTLKGDWGEARFVVEVADTPDSRAQGLMFRETLPTRSGMLFVYEQPQRVAFWMKNTLIPLDMVFVDETGRVQRVHHEAIPGDLTSIAGGSDILVVLEINGGLARRFGIGAGDVMQHPAIRQEVAIWPC